MPVGGIVIGHPTCDLALQRRIREARRDAVARSVDRRRVRHSWLDRVLGREPGERPADPLDLLDAEAFRGPDEDVTHALRY